MELQVQTAASSVTRNGSCRKKQVVKNAVKKPMEIKTVSHLQTDIAKQCGRQRLPGNIIKGLKSSLNNSNDTGFCVIFFEEDVKTHNIQDIMRLLHQKIDQVYQKAVDSIPKHDKHYASCIVTPYYCNENQQMHLYFAYTDFSYDGLVNKLTNVVKKLL